MARVGDGTLGVLLFCECMRHGDGGVSSTIVTWQTGEYDVLDTEAIYAAVAGHRAECWLQTDLYLSATQERSGR